MCLRSNPIEIAIIDINYLYYPLTLMLKIALERKFIVLQISFT
jgi:hypothetical protein